MTHGSRLMEGLNREVTKLLRARGYSGERASAAKREVWWWLQARQQSITMHRPLYVGRSVVWTSNGKADLVPVDVPAAAAGQVTVATELSAVSPGTERAQYLGLPTARVEPGHRPGVSAVGKVLVVGTGVSNLRPGDRVAASGVGHQSVFTVPEDRVVAVPQHVDTPSAAFLALGVIARQAVSKCALAPGEPYILLGAGLIGALTQRLATAIGAGPCTVVARSTSKQRLYCSADVERFMTLEDACQASGPRAAAVIEATGDPEILRVAVELTEPGGRIVLLGSPRGVTSPLPVDEIRQRQVTLIGGHVATVHIDGGRAARETFRDHAVSFVDALASGVELGELIDLRADPREADLVYRRLATDRTLAGVLFDWHMLPERAHPRLGGWRRLPDINARGVDFHGPHRRYGAGAGNEPRPRGGTSTRASGEQTHSVRFGFVGCGEIAVGNAAAVAAAPNAVTTAFFDPSRRLAEDLQARHGGVATDSLDELLARTDVDAVFVAVPHHLHEPLACAAMRAGKHVLIEKPLANDLASAVRIAQEARRTGLTVSVSFPQRYDPNVLAARQLIEGGALGDFQGLSLSFLTDKPLSYLHGGYSGRSASSWRSSKAHAGGGVLTMNMPHYLDLALHLSGAVVESVQAATSATDIAADVEDAITLAIRFHGRAVGSVVASSAVRGAQHEELRLWGSAGHVEVLPTMRVFSLRAVRDDLHTNRWHALEPQDPLTSRPRTEFVRAFSDAVATGSAPDVVLEAGLAVQSVIEAAYRSVETGTAVRPDDLLAQAGWS